MRSTCVATGSVADRWNWTFGHEVKVQELDQFHLHLAAGGTRFDERGDGQQPVKGFERARVGGVVEEGSNKGEQSYRLNGGAGRGIEEIEEELLKKQRGSEFAGEKLGEGRETNVHVNFSGEEGPGRGMDE